MVSDCVDGSYLALAIERV